MFQSLLFRFRMWRYRVRCALQRQDEFWDGNGGDQAQRKRAPRRKYAEASRTEPDPLPLPQPDPPPASPAPTAAPQVSKLEMLARAARARR